MANARGDRPGYSIRLRGRPRSCLAILLVSKAHGSESKSQSGPLCAGGTGSENARLPNHLAKC